MTPKQERELEGINSLYRMHDCPDGYRWQITQKHPEYEGVLFASDGTEVIRMEHPSYTWLETKILDALERRRTGQP